MSKTCGDNRYRDAGSKHLGRHEVPQIMKTEMLDASSLALPDELLGYPVRIPRTLAVCVVGEDEALILIALVGGLDQNPLILQ